jgi:hypothetical protein
MLVLYHDFTLNLPNTDDAQLDQPLILTNFSNESQYLTRGLVD